MVLHYLCVNKPIKSNCLRLTTIPSHHHPPSTTADAAFTSASTTSPSVLRPGLEVKLATSTIFTANCWPVSLLMQRLTTLKGPLKHRHTHTHTDLVADFEASKTRIAQGSAVLKHVSQTAHYSLVQIQSHF